MSGKFLVLAALLLLTALRVHAAEPPTLTCKVYDSEADVSETIGTLMDRYGDKSARACVDGAGKLLTYASLSAVAHNRFSVCQFEEIPRPAGVVSRTNRGDIVTFMLLIDGECPPHDDKRYIPAQDVSTGLFVELKRFWEDLSRNERTFESAFALLPAEQRAMPAFTQVRAHFLKKQPAPQLRSITLQSGTLFGSFAGYVMKGEAEGNSAVTIYVDLTDDGPKVMAIAFQAS
jgi:hypothetical protein